MSLTIIARIMLPQFTPVASWRVPYDGLIRRENKQTNSAWFMQKAALIYWYKPKIECGFRTALLMSGPLKQW